MAKKEVTNTEPSKRAHFAWQERVVARTDLSPIYKVVLWRLALHHNFETGRCDPSYLRLATGVGVSERTAKRAIAKAEKLGLLAIERNGRGSRHDRNHYSFVHDEGVSSQTPLEPQGVSSQSTKGCPRGHTNYKANDTLRGSERSAPAGRPDGTPASAGAGKDEAVAHGQELDALRAVWVRKRHIVTDAKPAAVRAQQQALDAALQSGVAFDVILAAAKPYAAAYDPENNDRQFLDRLEDWLGAKGWELPVPKRGKVKGANGKWHHRKPKSTGNAFYAEAGYERGADGVLREKGRTH